MFWGEWDSLGAVIEGGFWPMQEPQKMDDGHWIMAGFRIGGQFGETGNLPAVAISKGDDFTKWEMVVIPAAPGLCSIWASTQDRQSFSLKRPPIRVLQAPTHSKSHFAGASSEISRR